MIQAADYLVDIGPGAGAHGGELVAAGTLKEVLKSDHSVTAKYLRREYEIPLPDKRRKVVKNHCIEIQGAAENNLKSITVQFPLECFVCVTGVSGSGKSSLVAQTLLPALRRRLHGSREHPGKHKKIVGASRIDKIVEIDQSPIGRTPRSNPSTYTGVFDQIRQLYAKTREAKIRGYTPGRFSFNIKGGRCEECQGQGTKKIEMHFLPDIYVECDVCKGARYNRDTLEIKYRGKSIANVLDMRVDESIVFFDGFSKIKQLLLALSDVGLGYMTLGQSSTTLSGGEAQRVKLASELGKNTTGHTLYVLDEPTTGLHIADIHNLLNVLNRLANMGNTILVIEHKPGRDQDGGLDHRFGAGGRRWGRRNRRGRSAEGRGRSRRQSYRPVSQAQTQPEGQGEKVSLVAFHFLWARSKNWMNRSAGRYPCVAWMVLPRGSMTVKEGNIMMLSWSTASGFLS